LGTDSKKLPSRRAKVFGDLQSCGGRLGGRQIRKKKSYIKSEALAGGGGGRGMKGRKVFGNYGTSLVLRLDFLKRPEKKKRPGPTKKEPRAKSRS